MMETGFDAGSLLKVVLKKQHFSPNPPCLKPVKKIYALI